MVCGTFRFFFFFFFNDTATTEIYTLSYTTLFRSSAPRVDHHQAHPEVLLEGRPQELGLALAHQSVVDVDAGQPVAHGTVNKGRRDGRVDAAGELPHHDHGHVEGVEEETFVDPG